MGKLRVKWLKTGAFPRHIPVLLTSTVGSASPGEKEKLLGSAHAQRRYNASPTSGVQHGRFE